MRTSRSDPGTPGSYAAFGLSIRSVLRLPGVATDVARADAEIRIGKVGLDIPPPAPEGGYSRISSQDAHLHWEEVGSFRVRDGREIVIEPAPATNEKVLRLFTLGAPMALLLRQRGHLVLHASAVASRRGVIAFLGNCGSGKSTTAAAFVAQGFRMVTDDMLVVSGPPAPFPTVLPGFPWMKLGPDVISVMGGRPEDHEELHPKLEKRGFPVSGEFSLDPLPLVRIYVLEEGPEPGSERRSPQEGLVELVRHTYRIRSLGTGEAPAHFQQCAWVANMVPIVRLSIPRDLRELPSLVRVVEGDLSAAGFC